MSENDREFSSLSDSARNQPDAPRGRRMALIAGAAAVLAMAGFGLFAVFIPTPQVPAGILTATAAEGGPGGGYGQDGEVTSDPLLAANATELESRRNVAASSSISHSGGNRLFDRTLVICNRDDGLLMQRIGLAVFEGFRDTGRFQQVRYLPAGEIPPVGERLPEIFITLDNSEWKQSGIPVKRQYKGKFLVTACDRIDRSSHYYQHTLSPPQLQFRWRAEIDYSAEQTGIETSGARYQAVSRDLAVEIVEQLTKFLDDAAGKYGAAGDIPADFYPQYAAPPEFDFLSEMGAEKLVDGPAFMRPTVAVWQTPEDRIPREVVSGVRAALAEAGWKLPAADPDDGYLRATSNGQVLEVFRQNDGWNAGDRDADSKERVFIAYTRSMSEDEMDAAVDQMFSRGADERVLLMFQDHWHRHRDAVEAYFAERSPVDAASWLQLARLKEKSAPDAAREALLRANALRWIFHQEAPDSSMEKLAEELGLEALPRNVSQEMIELLPVSRLDAAGEQTLVAHAGAPAAIWLGETDGRQTWLLLTLRSRGAHPGLDLRINQVRLGDGSWSRSEQTLTKPDPSMVWEHRYHLGAGDRIEIACEPDDDKEAYRLTVRRTVSAE